MQIEFGDRFAGCVMVCLHCQRNVIVPSRLLARRIDDGRDETLADGPTSPFWSLVALMLALLPFAGLAFAAAFSSGHRLQWLGPCVVLVSAPVSFAVSIIAVRRNHRGLMSRIALGLSAFAFALVIVLILVAVTPML